MNISLSLQGGCIFDIMTGPDTETDAQVLLKAWKHGQVKH